MLALVRRPHSSLAEGERTYLDRAPIDFARAAMQHAAYVAALETAGVDVLVLPALDGFPDACFVEDVLIALPEAFIVTRPGAASRRDETAHILPHLPADRPVAQLAGGRLDGGDVIVAGRRIFVGASSRTDAEGVAALAAITGLLGYCIEVLALGGALHLRTVMTLLGDDTLVVSRGWASELPHGFQIIDAHAEEPFGANFLWLGDRALAQVDAPHTAAQVAVAGFQLVPVDISEFAKAEAGLTCLSVLVPSAALV